MFATMLAMQGPGRRAAPMTPEDRREAIVDAVMPLVGERGVDVTTKELAAAAGVAEGTLFRAFPDKNSLVGAVAIEGLRRTANPRDTGAELAGIDRTLPLVDRLTQVIELGRRRMGDVMRWMTVLRVLAHRTGQTEAAHGEQATTLRSELAAQRELQRAITVDGLTAVIRPDVDRLRVPIEVAVALVEAAIAGTHGRIDHLVPAPPPRVVADALVHGIAGPEPTAWSTGPPAEPNVSTLEPATTVTTQEP